MPEYGLTEKGFVRKPYTKIIADKEERARGFYGEDVDLSERSPLALFIQSDSWEESKLWDEMEKVYYSAYIDDAEGKQLDGLVKYVGLKRKPALNAAGEIEIRGRTGTEISAGLVVMTESNILFKTIDDCSLDENGYAKVRIEAVDAGKTGNVMAGKINRTFLYENGINRINNPERTSGGYGIESDEELRDRYYRSLFRKGKATRAAVEAAILNIPTVKDVYVRENDTIEIIDGLPSKCLAPYIFGGADEEIAKAIIETKAGGIQSYGEIVVDVLDNRNYPHKVGFTRAESIQVYVRVELVRNSMFKPGHEQKIMTDIVKYIGGLDSDGTEYKGLGLGRDVMRSKIIALSDDAGIDDAIVCLSIDGINYSKKNITLDVMEIATTDFGKVEIT